ncbi:MAG TPA: cupin domain-containing protein [Ktedonobacteraceae bacterium]|jgi:mannose-6-phosphate isomerase-like protein (cupin superfamily)
MNERTGYVITAEQQLLQTEPASGISWRVAIDRSVGCQNLEQRIFCYGPGNRREMLHDSSEDVMYVVTGQGRASIDGHTYLLKPGTGILAPPASCYSIENRGQQDLLLVSVLSPQPGQPAPGAAECDVAPMSAHTVEEAEQETLPAGERWFKLLVNPRMGCQNVTQFVGFIPYGRAPFHTHTYEEVIYIIEGAGVVHIGAGDFLIKAGSSIYLPPLLPHCIENTGHAPIRLLGVFCPAGDPSAKASEG